MLHPLYENKNYENLNLQIFFSERDLEPKPHAVASAAAGANDVSVSVFCLGFEFFANGSSPNTLADSW